MSDTPAFSPELAQLVGAAVAAALQERGADADRQTASLTVDAAGAAALVGVARSTWLSWDSCGRVPEPCRVGGRVFWTREAVVTWLRAGCPPRGRHT